MILRLICGKSENVLPNLPERFDSMVTDPPAGVEFMGKEWDSFKGDRRQPGDPTLSKSGAGPFDRAKVRHGSSAGYSNSRVRDNFIASMTAVFIPAYDALKPGAFGLIWALPRTSHWTAIALEDAGFEVRDVITHHFGQGFPKSLNVSKAFDKKAGAERVVLGSFKTKDIRRSVKSDRANGITHGQGKLAPGTPTLTMDYQVTAAATEDAKRWDGWGTALKPATEHWILVRKPLDGTVVENILEYGVGAMNIGASRVEAQGRPLRQAADHDPAVNYHGVSLAGRLDGSLGSSKAVGETDLGRWPANLVLSHSPDCRNVGTRRLKGDKRSHGTGSRPGGFVSTGSEWTGGPCGALYGDADGIETIDAWECVEGCPVALMDSQSGLSKGGPDKPVNRKVKSMTWIDGIGGMDPNAHEAPNSYGDEGGASRFFNTFDHESFMYQAKPGKAEKDAGLQGQPMSIKGAMDGEHTDNSKKGPTNALRPDQATLCLNTHPTVKGIKLMRWLVKLITPPGGHVLDPFTGSGTTGCACALDGFDFTGIEQDLQYSAYAHARIIHWAGKRV